MKDRLVKKANRRLITPEGGGTPYYAVIERADEPTEEGTPLNKNTLLSDAVAASLGLSGNDATPSNAFAKLAPKNSPILTGIPTAPTAVDGTNTDQLATTKFVMNNGGGGGKLTFVQRFTSNGTFNPANHPSKNNIYVFNIQGAGGGSAWISDIGAGNGSSGGGAGAFMRVELTITSSVTINVGTGGKSATGSGLLTGGAGGSSAISVLTKSYTAGGGNGGITTNSSQIPGFGGSVSTSYLGDPSIIMIIPGQHGHTSASGSSGGVGGLSPFGGTSRDGYGYGGFVGTATDNGGDGCVEVYRYV